MPMWERCRATTFVSDDFVSVAAIAFSAMLVALPSDDIYQGLRVRFRVSRPIDAVSSVAFVNVFVASNAV